MKTDRLARRVSDLVIGQCHGLVHVAAGASRHDLGLLLGLLSAIAHGLRDTTTRPHGLSDYLRIRSISAPETSAAADVLIGDESPAALREHARLVMADVKRTLTAYPQPAVVDSTFGPVRLADFLRANLIDLVVLGRRIGFAPGDDAMAEAVRSLTAVLGARFGGQTIEVRVPPYAATQVGAFGEGPTHTRGTPPNVIETSPDVFFDLAIGARTWAEVAASGQVSASGAHVDQIARMLPVVRLAD